jgi:hypothetical protein
MHKLPIISKIIALIITIFPWQLLAQVPENGLVFDGNNDYVNVGSYSADELNATE